MGVGIADSKRCQRQVFQPLQYLSTVITQILQQIARMVGQAGAMRVEVSNGYLAGDVGIAKGKPRQLRYDGRIPGHDVVGYRMRHHRGADRFGHRRQLKDGVGVHLVVRTTTFAHVSDTEPFGIQRLSAMDYRHCHSGYAGILHQLADQAVDLCHGIVDAASGDLYR
ncbi:Uncharacterised protein [Mycobacterium tuberculosis]|uniref:Uncharacterized protein n=3 Tax=Mycobacterium tuberculosis TaxID=1773 RepID=A0A654TUW1_MYCTX|nr:Uncharacterised protein [Mycobacterium tuberculosis]COZ71832.1 Uncharacterised protein [Mycobacterium tuberculosis]